MLRHQFDERRDLGWRDWSGGSKTEMDARILRVAEKGKEFSPSLIWTWKDRVSAIYIVLALVSEASGREK